MFGLYIHIPFCVTKCYYCDFNSRPADSGEIDEYLSALMEEIRLFSRENQRIVETLYIGGGTPTLLTEKQLSRLMAAVQKTMTLMEDAEITLEANPGTLNLEKIKCIRELGVNRISLGVQSLRDPLLLRLGRSHSSAEAWDALEMLREQGFQNIGADLIYGIPGQRPGDWEEDLSRLIEFRPEHLSLYELSIEKGTPFAREVKKGKLHLPSEDQIIGMFKKALQMTVDGGYEHYEISNYARPGFRSRHNTLYWAMDEYYGVGAGAHSFLRMDGPLRLSNVTDPQDYIKRMKGTRDPVARRELLPRKTYLAEAMMMGLRMTEGISIPQFQKRYGVHPLAAFEKKLKKGMDHRWIEVGEERIRLTEEGRLFSNEVFVELF